MPLRGGGAGPLMANAIKNFHFDYLKPSLSDNMCFVHDRRSLERVRIGLALNTVRTPLQKNFFGPFLQLNLVYWNFLSYRFDTVVLIQLALHDRTIEEMKGPVVSSLHCALCTVICALEH